jgi:hypothetical protein
MIFRLLATSSVVLLLVNGSRDDLYDFKVDELGVTSTLWCNASIQYESAPNDSVPVSWMLPDLTVLYTTTGRYNIQNDNMSLIVSNITRDDIGQYHCMLKYPTINSSEDWYLARVGLNAQGPYFEDLWDKYELNTIIGISAGFGFLACAIAMMVIYHFRWRGDEEEPLTEGEGGLNHKNEAENVAETSDKNEEVATPVDDNSPVGDIENQKHLYSNEAFTNDTTL